MTDHRAGYPPIPGRLDPLMRRGLMAVLAKVPGRLEDLDVTITRTDQLAAEHVGSSGHHERVVPFHQGASDARVRLERELRRYAARVGIVVHRTPPHDPAGKAGFLRRWLPGIPGDAPSIDGIYPAIVGAFDAATREVDRRPERVYVGVCGDECPTALYALRGDVDGWVECRTCGREVSVTERRESMLGMAQSVTGTAAELARVLPWFAGRAVEAKTISKWAERGKLPSHVDALGRTVFRIGDVLALHYGLGNGQQPVATA